MSRWCRAFVLTAVVAGGCGRLGYSEGTDAAEVDVDSGAGLDGAAGRDAWPDAPGPPVDACPMCAADAARPLGDLCARDIDCASGHCAEGVCCDAACTGTCDECTGGECMPTDTCSGDCAICSPDTDGFSCRPDPDSCLALCSSATCAGAGTSFACDTSTCCRTADAPNFTGRCGAGVDVLLGNGCRFEWGYSRCCIPVPRYVEVEWDVQQCTDGVWVGVDSGADAHSCSSCADRVSEGWTDDCGDLSAASVICG